VTTAIEAVDRLRAAAASDELDRVAAVAWATEQMAALGILRDTQWLRDLDRQALADRSGHGD
jgi:hypothetical protein